MLFRPKRKQKQNNNQLLLQSLNGKEVKYVSSRDRNSYGETIIGKNGVINISNDELLISCEGNEVFRHPLNELEGGELMSYEGINLRYPDNDGKKCTVIAYYKYYRK